MIPIPYFTMQKFSDDSKSTKSKEARKLDNQPSVLGDDAGRDGRLLRPADQLQLSESELKVEHERILNAKNPYAPDNIVRFNFSTNEFQKDIHVDHFATHFQLKGKFDTIDFSQFLITSQSFIKYSRF